jgi:hypothetical protein
VVFTPSFCKYYRVLVNLIVREFMNKSILIGVLLISLSCSSRPCADVRLENKYRDGLTTMGIALSMENLDHSLIEKRARFLTDTGTEILLDFRRKRPECHELVSLIVESQGQMLSLDLDELEERFHEGVGLPESPDHCFNAKELIVHPQTMRVLARMARQSGEDQREDLQAEYSELLAHFELFLRELN